MKKLITVSALWLASLAGYSQTYTNINSIGWKFSKGDDPRYKQSMYEDNSWRSVTLPHDWSILSAPGKINPTGGEGGYYQAGKAWYRAKLPIGQELQNQKIYLYCEGIYMNSEIYVNGRYAGGHKYGYSSFYVDITDLTTPGHDATIAIKVDNSQQKNSRWYSGSGIYRNIWLVTCPMVHMDLYDPFVYTQEMGSVMSLLGSKTRIYNDDVKTRECTLTVNGEYRKTVTVAPGCNVEVEIDFQTPGKIWEPENPNLTDVSFELSGNGFATSRRTVKSGIREFEYSAEKGLLLNKRPILLNGACVHHDNGILGAAAYGAADIRKAKQLKDAGFNAVRTSHNPPSPYFLSACDSLGLIVIDEAFDGWYQAKNPHDYSEIIDSCWRDDLEKMVLRDRSHPSVFCWSIGNEILERKSDSAVLIAHQMHDHIMKLDNTRPVTQALAAWDNDWEIFDPLAAGHEIIGYNYLIHKAEGDHERVPGRVIMQTESFPKDAYSNYRASADHSYILGDFVWTGIDYLGESGIGRYYYEGETEGESWMADMYPWHGAYCGDIDITGWRKPISHYRSLLWNNDEQLYMAVREPNGFVGNVKTTMWSVWPTWESWTWPGMEGREIEVEVASRLPRVQLFLNGKLLEEKTVGDDMKAVFKVKYKPGTLTAKGLYMGVKNAFEECSLKTAGNPASVKLEAERIESPTDTLVYYTALVVDKNGNICPNADNEIVFELNDNGRNAELLATGSADLKDKIPAKSTKRKAWKGRALAVVKVSGNADDIDLKAKLVL